ncbi:hypothetical protein D9758_014031 [Tetrapyrgos nigripes]|uniref:Uncharacterized protein n=1 Tax=Tetrapyrgos nigripes TaxID=182062 RepID=A0A8H5CXI7_9AGAR|nr:hypothetical protein D9758_014031 [Tetrapyrgos nigripes]
MPTIKDMALNTLSIRIFPSTSGRVLSLMDRLNSQSTSPAPTQPSFVRRLDFEGEGEEGGDGNIS